jgi:hypothetical protein
VDDDFEPPRSQIGIVSEALGWSILLAVVVIVVIVLGRWALRGH